MLTLAVVTGATVVVVAGVLVMTGSVVAGTAAGPGVDVTGTVAARGWAAPADDACRVGGTPGAGGWGVGVAGVAAAVETVDAVVGGADGTVGDWPIALAAEPETVMLWPFDAPAADTATQTPARANGRVKAANFKMCGRFGERSRIWPLWRKGTSTTMVQSGQISASH